MTTLAKRKTTENPKVVQAMLKEISHGINVIDIGCSGALNPKWKPIYGYINLAGFDPNEEECKRLASLPHNFRSVKYIPHAIAGHNGPATLYKTKSMYCFSLLKPDTPWLKRFAFHELLDVVGEETLEVRKLSSIDELGGLDIDVLKIDAQGMELEILKTSGGILDKVIYAETESGFTPNYINESTQSQVDEYMRAKGFLLFDLIITRMTHNNIFSETNKDRAQCLWSESIWLKDYIRLHKEKRLFPGDNINREKALKVLTICALQQCIDYGYELAKIFQELGLIDRSELEALENKQAWELEWHLNTEKSGREEDGVESRSRVLNFLLRLLPASTRSVLGKEAGIAASQKHILKSM